ncbi:uncharacterized protein LOC109813361 [Cajanus cajan]|uniref:uncharacterized protein LOC109813361 n=1 Tax=Cajanus cajan TaxID=3821 RepID=UPI00098DAFC9|nr:uncharacterized protein LOC109813361 [Cajanus cajan]
MEIRCKLFMGTLKKAALDWFSGLPDRSITDFDVFSRLFMAQFAANRKKPPITSDLFDLKQQHEESLKEFLQRFNEIALRIASLDERMAVDHGGRARAEWTRSNEEEKFTPLNVPRRQILHDVNCASLFEFPAATERQLGPFKTDWCEVHRTHGHTTENCFVLGRQIERLIKEGRLKKFVARKQEEGSSERRHRHTLDDARRERRREKTPLKDPPAKASEVHQKAIHGDFNTMAGGFAGGGVTSAAQKRYTCSVLSVSEFCRSPQPTISFSDADYEGVAPHEDDPIVIST